MADDSLQDAHVPKQNPSLRSAHVYAKVAQVVLAVITIGLIIYPFESFQQIFIKPRVRVADMATVYVTLAGFIIINMVLLLTYFFGERVPKRTEIMFAGLGAFMHVVSAIVMFSDWRRLGGNYVYAYNNAIYPSKLYMDMLLSAILFTFINAGVFAFDVYVTFKYT